MQNSNEPLRIVIVGGVAGGASAATRARRLSESAQITLLERGEHVSFANCGLPYHIGGVIPNRERLLVQTPAGLRKRFNIDVRTRSEVTAVDPAGHSVTVHDLANNQTYTLPYDKLILSPGAAPIRPPVPGIDLSAVLTLRNLADMDLINAAAARHGSAVVIGAGYIGLEMVDNLAKRGLTITLVEKLDQVFPLLDRDMAGQVAELLKISGVKLVLGDGLAGFEELPADQDARLRVLLASGRSIDTDFAVLAVGVRPEVTLAKAAGLAIGQTGGIEVNEHMQTSQPDIYAVGDSVQVQDFVTGQPAVIPLAGPANRQGRIAADHIFAAQPDSYRGTQGTSIVGLFGTTIAMTGGSERTLLRAGVPHRVAYLHPSSHAGYYPGALPMHIKLLFAPGDGRVLGAQIVGGIGVDKRIDVLATAVRHGLTVFDLEELELAYAPAYGSAKDPVNMAGFIAANSLRGITDLSRFADLDDAAVVLDVRTPEEFAAGHHPDAVNIPVDQLRSRLNELPRDRKIHAYCGVGMRAYIAERILKQSGFDSANLSGGWKTWCASRPASADRGPGCDAGGQGGPGKARIEVDSDPQTVRKTAESVGQVANLPQTGIPGDARAFGPAAKQDGPVAQVIELDARGLQCPGPILQLSNRINEIAVGARLRVLASDPGFLPDVQSWAAVTGHRLVESGRNNGHFMAVVEKNEPKVATTGNDIKSQGGFTAVVFSGSMDKALAALVLANGAAATGQPTTLFFTFWGLSLLRKPRPARGFARGLLDRMFAWMLPAGPRKLKLSQWHFGGAGRMLMNYRMKSKNVMNLDELLASALAAGVRMVACQMSLDMLGLRKEDLIDGVEIGGVANFMESASAGRVNLFI